MSNFIIMRNGLNTEIVGDQHIGQSSEDVTVAVTDDGTYQGYNKKLYYSYGYKNKIYRAIADENSNGEFIIPMAAFLKPGIVKLSLELSNGANKPTCNACFIRTTEGAKLVAASDILPDEEETWQSYIRSYIDFDIDYRPAVDALGKRIDNLILSSGPAVDALGKRIDNLILSSGTESSAEVIDARTGYDGTAYDTLGTAIRSQVSPLKKNLVPDEIIFKGKSKFTGGWKSNVIVSDITFYKYHFWCIIINLHSDVVGSSYIQIKNQSGQIVSYWQLENLKAGKHKFFYVPMLDYEHSSVCITSETYVDTCDFEISNNYTNNIEKLSFEVDYLKKDEHKFDYTKFIIGQIYDKYTPTAYEVQNGKPFIFDQDILVKVNDGFNFCITGFNSDGTYNNYYSGWKTSNESLVVKKNTYFRIGIVKIPNAEITSMEEIKEYVSSVTYSLGDTIDDIKNDISNLNATLSTSIQNKISNKMMLNIIQNDIYFSHLDVDYYDGLIIPSQSIYDVMRSKRLGFKMMELNARKTSDGVFYAFHGYKNCFGKAFYSLDNTDISNVNVSDITSEYINNNIRYKSKYKKYQVIPSTLKEVLIECKKNQIIPLIEYNDGVIEFVKSIMPENSYIIGIYNRDRPNIEDIGDSICSSWLYGDVDSVIAKANKSGGCYICGIDVTKDIYQSFNTDEWTDYIGKIHNSGYFVSCAYQSQKDTQKLLNAGIDLIASNGSINDLKYGNIFDSESDMLFSDFITNGTINDGILHLNNGQTIMPSNLSENVFLGGSSMYIIFNGNIHIKMGIIDEEFTSDGKNTLWFSTFYQESIPTFLITAKSDDTRILYLSFKSSKL